MKGIFINCPNCRKVIFKDAYIRVGSYFTSECARCGYGYILRSESGKITLKRLQNVPVEDEGDDESGIVFMSS